MKLYAHQQKLVDEAPDKHLLAWGCGSGKTIATLKLASKSSTLVICPKSIKEQWCDEVKKHSKSVYCFILTKEGFKKEAPTLPKYDCIIVDEAHFFFGMTGFRKKSAMLKSLLAYIKKHNPEKIYLATATPYMSTPYNIYAAAQILGRQWDFRQYKEYFFNMVNMGRRFPVPVVKKGIEGDIAKLVQKLGSTVSLEDCFDVPEQTFLTEYFDLTREQKRAINALDDEGIARWTKTHQICGGTLKGDGYVESQSFKSEKMDRVLQLAEEHKKLIIVCRYNYELQEIKKRLGRLKISCSIINGETQDRHAVVRESERRRRHVNLIQASCSEGYELPSFPVMVYYSYDFSLKNYIQMNGRILRANKLKKNVYISLVVKGGIDEDVYKCIQSKKDFDLAIYDNPEKQQEIKCKERVKKEEDKWLSNQIFEAEQIRKKYDK